MKRYISTSLTVVGLFMIGFAQLVGIGTVLFEWANDIQLSTALWDGFVRWILMVFNGLVILLAGVVIED